MHHVTENSKLFSAGAPICFWIIYEKSHSSGSSHIYLNFRYKRFIVSTCSLLWENEEVRNLSYYINFKKLGQTLELENAGVEI